VNSLPKTVTRQRRGCDLNPGPTALESSMLTTWLPSHPSGVRVMINLTRSMVAERCRPARRWSGVSVECDGE